MTAAIVPFPPARRVGFVSRQATRIAELNENAGERHLQQTLLVQRQAMERRGIDAALIQREMKCLEAAIRASLWRVILTPGGA
jgi:Family of unknown function (DUF6074)